MEEEKTRIVGVLIDKPGLYEFKPVVRFPIGSTTAVEAEIMPYRYVENVHPASGSKAT